MKMYYSSFFSKTLKREICGTGCFQDLLKDLDVILCF